MFDKAYETVDPGENITLVKKIARVLQPLLVGVGVLLAVGWWKGETPGRAFLFNLAILLLVSLSGARRQRSVEEIEQRLSRLVNSGNVPEASVFYDILDNAPENPYEDLVNRYALGMIQPDEFRARMTAKLRAAQ